MNNPSSPRLLILGAGPGGYPAAFLAADVGMEVVLIDTEENPGGACLYRGCIPSKALLHVARLIHETQAATDWGIDFGTPGIDLEKLREWKDQVIRKLTGGLGQLRRARKVKHIRARGRFLNARTVSVAHHDGSEEKVEFDYAIIATGSRPVEVPALSIDSPRVMDSTGALQLESIPENLLVVGGGYIGLELGTVYSALGSEVTVVEMTSGLLPGADRDLVDVLEQRLRSRFKEILLEAQVLSLEDRNGSVMASLSALDLEPAERSYSKVLIAVGRRPNTSDLGLESTQIELDARGFIKVNEQRRTAEPKIFAIGDVTGEPMLAHKATHEARVAVETIAGRAAAFEPQAIPAIVFTDPELAWCGLTETQALTENRKVKIARFPWSASGRAATLARTDGLTKLLADPVRETILGVGIVGPNAGELIAEATHAIEMGATITDLKLTIHPHPTLSETLMEAAELLHSSSVHYSPPGK